MSIELSKGKRILFYIAILLTNVAVMGELVMTPIIYNLYDTFSYNMAGVNFIVSGPPLIVVAASLAASKLCNAISKKKVLIMGASLFAIGSLFCVVVPTIPYMIVMRTVVGVGEGIVNVAAMAFIAEVYIDEQKRSTFMGIYTAAMSAIGAILSGLSGILAESGWRYAFRAYWLSIPMLLFVILFIPNLEACRNESDSDTDSPSMDSSVKKEPYGTAYLFMMVIYCLFNLGYATITYYISTYTQEQNLGGTSFAGFLTAMCTVGSLIISLMFGKIYQKLAGCTSYVAIVMGLISAIMLHFVPGKTTSILAMFMIGGAYGIMYSFAYAHGSALVPISRINDAMGWATIGYALPMFCSTYFVTWLMNDVFHTTSITTVWAATAGIYLFILVFQLIISINARKLAD